MIHPPGEKEENQEHPLEQETIENTTRQYKSKFAYERGHFSDIEG